MTDEIGERISKQTAEEMRKTIEQMSIAWRVDKAHIVGNTQPFPILCNFVFFGQIDYPNATDSEFAWRILALQSLNNAENVILAAGFARDLDKAKIDALNGLKAYLRQLRSKL